MDTRQAREQAIPGRFPATVQDMFNYVGRMWHDGQIRCVVHFGERVNAARMERAIRLTLDAQPVLGCRLVERRWRPYWQRRPDLDELRLCPVERGEALESRMWDFLSAPVDPEQGPLIHTRLFRNETDTLCVKLDHGGGDGAGAMQYLNLLAETYRALGDDPGYRPPSQIDADRGQWPVFRRVGPFPMLRSLLGMRLVKPDQQMPGYGPDASGRAIALRRVPAARVAALRAYGRERQAKFNDLLVAAFYRALFSRLQIEPGERCLLALPVNLRRYLRPGHEMPVANLSGGNAYGLSYQPGETFDDTLARVVATSQRFKGAYPGLGAAALQALWFGPSFAAGRWLIHRMIGRAMAEGKMGPFLSNVGVIDEQFIDFGDVAIADAFGLGLISFPPNLNLAASTFRGVLTLTSGYCPTAIAPEVVEGFLDDVVRELPDGAAGGEVPEPISAYRQANARV